MSLIKENISSEFDAFSKNYKEDMIAVVPHYEALLEAFLKAIPQSHRVEQVLDIGCGNGIVTDLLLSRYSKTKYTLLDASHEMLSLCKQRFEGYEIDYIQSYFSDFDFPTSAYDLVVAGFSLHHCQSEEKQHLFKKIHTALKPGGLLVMSDLFIAKSDDDHPALLEEWKAHVLGHNPEGDKWDWLMEHYEAFDRPDNLVNQTAWLQQAGFSEVKVVWRNGHWINLCAVKS